MCEISSDLYNKNIKNGARDAVYMAMCMCSDMPGWDTFEAIQKGTREAVLEWLNTHKDEMKSSINIIINSRK